MADTATAPANEKPATIHDLRLTIDALLDRGEADEALTGRIVALTEVKRELDRALKATKSRLEPLHDQMLDTFTERGDTSARHAESGKLVYVNRRIWARAASEDKSEACAALKAAGLDAFVAEGFNTTSLSAYFNEQVKEREADGEPVTDLDDLLPPELKGRIALTQDHTIGVRS